MNMEERDKLRSLFQEMKFDEPSTAFESRLMQQVHIVAAKKERRHKVISVISIIGAIAGMLGIPALIYWYMGIPLKPEVKPIETSLTFEIPSMHFDPFIVSIACVALLLLISDTLIRRRIWEKKHKD
jgi:hypothetical protein